MAQSGTRPLFCARGGCGKPFARVQQGAIVIESKHDGAIHCNVVPFEQLRRLMDEYETGRHSDAPLTILPAAETAVSNPVGR